MFRTWTSAAPRRRVIEDPDELGYRVVADRLLDVMDADEWFALERAATDPGRA
jgi:hypothetical protein